MLMTMSISLAPARTASRASYDLAVGDIAPRGKPTTAQTITPEPPSSDLAIGTQVEFTHTDAKRYLRASSHSLRMSSRVTSGLSSVWSISDARSTGTCPLPAGAATRLAPASWMARTDH